MAEQETCFIQGEGGTVFEMDLPLPSDIANRVRAGQIQRVNEDGSAWESSDDDERFPPETEVDRVQREREAALEYARLKLEKPDADPIELRDEAAAEAGDEIPDAAQRDGKPARSESKDAWVDYAVESGLSRDEADSMSKAELVKRFSR